MHVEPKFSNNRFFVSPIIGCNGQCVYCYLAIEEYAAPSANMFGIDKTIEFLLKDKKFISGSKGSIISVGALGDLFPSDTCLRGYSIEWIKKLLLLGNPMQIMSKNELFQEEIDEIVSSIKYNNQLLFSTTIVTFDHDKLIEKGVNCSLKRLLVLNEFEKRGVPINIMIKPFIPGITSEESDKFIRNISFLRKPYCVIGKLFINNKIYKNILESSYMKDNIEEIIFEHTGKISCIDEYTLHTYSNSLINAFIEKLRENNIQVFKKSSCVNANILNFKNKNRDQYIATDCCINCGNCT